MNEADYGESHRYFDLFQASLRTKHCELAYNRTSGKCTVIGGNRRGEFKFEFEVSTIKNHYCTFRIANNEVDVYLAKARSQAGVVNWFQKGLVTPPRCELAYGEYNETKLEFRAQS
jgi:hypothetical protein